MADGLITVGHSYDSSSDLSTRSFSSSCPTDFLTIYGETVIEVELWFQFRSKGAEETSPNRKVVSTTTILGKIVSSETEKSQFKHFWSAKRIQPTTRTRSSWVFWSNQSTANSLRLVSKATIHSISEEMDCDVVVRSLLSYSSTHQHLGTLTPEQLNSQGNKKNNGTIRH